MYNPIFEQEVDREKELVELKKAIKLRATKDQVKDLGHKFATFVKAHPIFTTVALGVFGSAFIKK